MTPEEAMQYISSIVKEVEDSGHDIMIHVGMADKANNRDIGLSYSTIKPANPQNDSLANNYAFNMVRFLGRLGFPFIKIDKPMNVNDN